MQTKGLAGIKADESAISFVDGAGGKTTYRGILLRELAEKSSFLEVAWLLIFGTLPKKTELEKFTHDIRYHTRIKKKLVDAMWDMPQDGQPMSFLQATVGAFGIFYPMTNVLDPQERYWGAVRLLAKMPTLVAAIHRIRRGDDLIKPREDLPFAGNFYWMMFEREPDEIVTEILDKLLIVHADHDFNCSTFTCRTVGSARADVYTAISSAIGALSGPLHGAASEDALAMLEEIGSADRAEAYINDKLAKKAKLPGLGHKVYSVKDPRAYIIQDLIKQLVAKHNLTLPLFQTALKVEEIAEGKLAQKGVWPNVDFFSGLVYKALGIPLELNTCMFAMGRTAGWLAHWFEIVRDNATIYRPSQEYVGDKDMPYIPIPDRG